MLFGCRRRSIPMKFNWPWRCQDRSINTKRRRCLYEGMTPHPSCLQRLVFPHSRKYPSPNNPAPQRTSDAHGQWTEMEEDSKPVYTAKVEWRSEDGHGRTHTAERRRRSWCLGWDDLVVGTGALLVFWGRPEQESACGVETTVVDCIPQKKDHCRSMNRRKELPRRTK